MIIPVRVLERVPGAQFTVKWQDICHSREEFVLINHNDRRWVSRWDSVERKRAFDVIHWQGRKFRVFSYLSHPTSSHATFEAAMKAAKRLANQLNKEKAA